MSDKPDIVRRARELLATATKGPWGWFGSTSGHDIYLATKDRGRIYVMDFARWGMQKGTPRFQVRTKVDPERLAGLPYRKEGKDYWIGIMTPAHEMVKYEVAPVVGSKNRKDPRLYRHDFKGIDHPDATLIAEAPELIAGLLEEVDRLRGRLLDDEEATHG